MLLKQLKQRLPENLKNVSLFSINNMLEAINDVPKYCDLMKYIGVSDQGVADAKMRLSKLNLIDWTEKKKQNYLE